MLISKDCFLHTPDRTILTKRELHIPNLRSIGMGIVRSAVLPLQSHIHPDCMEFVVLLKGKQCYTVDDQIYQVAGGDVFVTFPDQPHGSGSRPQEVNHMIWFQLEMEKSDSFLGLAEPFGQLLYQKLSNIQTPLTRVDPFTLQLIRHGFLHFAKLKPDEILNGLSMLVSFLNCFCQFNHQQRKQTDPFQSVTNYIDAHIEENISLLELSRQCGLSESRFKHKFAEVTGYSPKYYINAKKIDRAKELLAQSDIAITDIALRLSFDTSNYFATVFRRYTGLTPSLYRKQVRQSE